MSKFCQKTNLLLKCKNFIYLQLKFVKLFYKYNEQSTQLPVIKAVISQVNSVFLQKITQTYSKNFTYEAKQKYCN
jgi:hypothetical protein